jgi:UDP-N-acetyl-D-glucosamine dehydrogenase
MEIRVGLTPAAKSDYSFDLEQKIRDHSAQLGVIGLGYVGLPLAVEMAQSDFHVTGIDIDGKRVNAVNEGVSHVLDVPG